MTLPTGQLGEIIRQIRPSVQDDADLTDDRLLDRFTKLSDSTALSALIGRHGPMVWGVCRRILRNRQDAEDAFQATFLVLVSKATTIRPSHRVAAWLYGVARNTALYVRSTIAKRKVRERQVEEMPEPETRDREVERDQLDLLDVELGNLPERYRTAIVLCDLEGKTRKEAAVECGVPEGTVSSWLNRGRAMLTRRLTRHGIGFSTVAALFTRDAVSGEVPKSVLSTTIQLASGSVSGQRAASDAISARVSILVEGVSKTMLLNKLRTLVVVMGIALTFTVGAIASLNAMGKAVDPPQTKTGPSPAGRPQPEKAAEPLPPLTSQSKNEPKEVIVRDAGTIARIAFGFDRDTVVSIGRTEVQMVGDVNDANGPIKAINPTAIVRLWDAKTGELKKTLLEQKDSFCDIALSKNGKKAAILLSKIVRENQVGGQPPRVAIARTLIESEIQIRDVGNWEIQQKLTKELELRPGESIAAIALSPDGKMLVFGGPSCHTESGSFMRIWDVSEKKIGGVAKRSELQNIPEPKPQPAPGDKTPLVGCGMRLAFSPDGEWIAAGDFDGKVRLYSAKTIELQSTLGERGDPTAEIAFSPDGKHLATLTRTVNLWDLQTGKVAWKLKSDPSKFTKMMTSIAFSPDGKLLAASGCIIEEIDDGGTAVKFGQVGHEINVWSTETGEIERTLPSKDDKALVYALAFSPDGKVLAVGGEVIDGKKSTGQIKLSPLELWNRK